MNIDGGDTACFAVPGGRSFIKPFINLLLYDAFGACLHVSCGRTAGTVSLVMMEMPGLTNVFMQLHSSNNSQLMPESSSGICF